MHITVPEVVLYREILPAHQPTVCSLSCYDIDNEVKGATIPCIYSAVLGSEYKSAYKPFNPEF